MAYGSSSSRCKVFIGNLPGEVKIRDIEDLCDPFGKVVDVDLKNARGPPFAFVKYDDPRDADEAVYRLNKEKFKGYELRVEFPRDGGRGGSGFGSRFRGRGGRGGGGGRRGGRRSEYSVTVSGLPPTGSWQDLKDHMREAGDVLFTDVYRDGTGYVEFARSDDVSYAIRKLNDTKFKSHEGESSFITVRERSPGRVRGRSYSPRRSPPRRYRGSPTYSPRKTSYSRSRSRSRSRSPY